MLVCSYNISNFFSIWLSFYTSTTLLKQLLQGVLKNKNLKDDFGTDILDRINGPSVKTIVLKISLMIIVFY